MWQEARFCSVLRFASWLFSGPLPFSCFWTEFWRIFPQMLTITRLLSSGCFFAKVVSIRFGCLVAISPLTVGPGALQSGNWANHGQPMFHHRAFKANIRKIREPQQKSKPFDGSEKSIWGSKKVNVCPLTWINSRVLSDPAAYAGDKIPRMQGLHPWRPPPNLSRTSARTPFLTPSPRPTAGGCWNPDFRKNCTVLNAARSHWPWPCLIWTTSRVSTMLMGIPGGIEVLGSWPGIRESTAHLGCAVSLRRRRICAASPGDRSFRSTGVVRPHF